MVEQATDFIRVMGGTSREQFRERMLRTMPQSIHATMRAEWARQDALSEEEREAEEAAKDRERRMDQLAGLRLQYRNQCGLRGDQWLNTFQNYVPAGLSEDRLSQKNAQLAAKRFVAAFPQTRGLMFWGKPGRGKDHLLHAIVHELLKKDDVWRIQYAYSLDLERRFYAEWGRHNDDVTDLEESLLESDAVLIGDLHKLCRIDSQSVNARRVERAMMRIINHADAVGGLVLCATSNYPLENAPDGKDWARIVDDPALISRLGRVFEWIEVKGPDRRRS